MMDRIRIFLVEDSKIIGGILKRCLEMKGAFEVSLFQNYAEIMECLKHEKPRLVITDYFLDPDPKTAKNGGNVALDVKKMHPNSLVILLTGMEDTSKIPIEERVSFDRILNKNEHEVMDNLEVHILNLLGQTST